MSDMLTDVMGNCTVSRYGATVACSSIRFTIHATRLILHSTRVRIKRRPC